MKKVKTFAEELEASLVSTIKNLMESEMPKQSIRRFKQPGNPGANGTAFDPVYHAQKAAKIAAQKAKTKKIDTTHALPPGFRGFDEAEEDNTPTHPEIHKVLTDAGWKHTGNRPHTAWGKPVSKPHSWYDSPNHFGIKLSVGKSGKWARHGIDRENGSPWQQSDEGVNSLKRTIGVKDA